MGNKIRRLPKAVPGPGQPANEPPRAAQAIKKQNPNNANKPPIKAPARAPTPPPAKPAVSVTRFIRFGGHFGDITLSIQGALRNQYALTEFTNPNGSTYKRKEFPFKSDEYSFIQQFGAMTVEDKIKLIGQTTFEIAIRSDCFGENIQGLCQTVEALGSTFSDNVQKLVISIESPSPDTGLNGLAILNSPSYLTVKRVVGILSRLSSLKVFQVILKRSTAIDAMVTMPEVACLVPFFEVTGVKWYLKFQGEGMYGYEQVASSSFNRIRKIYRQLMEEEQKRLDNIITIRPSADPTVYQLK